VNFFKKYSETHVHFIDLSIPKMLENLLKQMNKDNKSFSIIDLGCGDGRLLYALHISGLLHNAKRVVGVDISKERIERMKKILPFAEAVVADVTDLKEIADSAFDIAISTQVIEHVSDDVKMLREVRRILKAGGYLYISTVVKKCAFWIYYEKGKGFKLDPTHVREYKSEEEFLKLLSYNGFDILSWRTEDVRYPIIDLILRVLAMLKIVKLQPDFYLKHKLLRKLRILKLKVPGYKIIEVIALKV